MILPLLQRLVAIIGKVKRFFKRRGAEFTFRPIIFIDAYGHQESQIKKRIDNFFFNEKGLDHLY